MTEHACPYCDKQVAARGRKNHVRLMSGNGHGEQGTVPASYQEDIEATDTAADSVEEDTADSQPVQSEDADTAADSVEEGNSEPQEVTADELGDTEPEQPDTESDTESDGRDLPFNPDAEGAIELDGDETLHVRHNGEIVEANPDAGDWLLITPDGPVLYDTDDNTRFEVITE